MSALIEALASSPVLLGVSVTLLGLLVGSFLNVVILRLPQMMEAGWKNECRVLLEIEPPADPTPKISLTSPPSCCPSCKAAIRPWQNIPVVSWLLLRGRCAHCGTGISVQYPLVEAVSAIMAAVCAWRFGWSPQLAAALILTWALIALTVIDLREMLLPDDITLPLLWLGLALSTVPVFAGMPGSIWGGIFGYLSLWSIYHLFKLVTGKEGMGYGDFKLLAAIGAWFGWQLLPAVILLSSLAGSIIGIGLIVLTKHGRNVPIPFGPYLALGGIAALFLGPQLSAFYLGA